MSSWGKFNPDQPSKKYWSSEEAIEKLSTFCAYQERCLWEVRRKLFEKGIDGELAQKVLEEMITTGFVDEERYARAFARGKFKLKKWGRTRIQRELKMREISPALIRCGLSEIDEVEYYDVLLSEAEKKWAKTTEKEPFKKRFKLVQYLMSKGFEQDLVKEALFEITQNLEEE